LHWFNILKTAGEAVLKKSKASSLLDKESDFCEARPNFDITG